MPHEYASNCCFVWLCPCNTVVIFLTHNPTIKGSNPAIGTGRENNVKKLYRWFCQNSTVVRHLTHNPMAEVQILPLALGEKTCQVVV